MTKLLKALRVGWVIVTVPWLAGLQGHKPARPAENHAPVVQILSPENNTGYTWNSPMAYEISVSDQEDGESKFQEIESMEVLLMGRYFADTGAANADKDWDSSPGLTEIRGSNCLNCHAFNGKLIGPSFREIAGRYADGVENRSRLKKSVVDGLSGVWGKEVMPTHPELSSGEAEAMVQWILTTGRDSTIRYARGAEGAFRMAKPAGAADTGVLVLSASYLDHGLKDEPGTRLSGKSSIRLFTH